MRWLAVLAVPLVLGTTTVYDPNDVTGLLDLKSGKAVRDGKLLRFTITTYDGWASNVLQGSRAGRAGPLPGKNRLTVLYDVNGDGRTDYTGRIVYWKGSLGEWITGRKSAFEPLPVKRPNAKTASFTHPVDVLFKSPKGTKTLRLAVTSRYGAAHDRMPNHGWIPVVFHLS